MPLRKKIEVHYQRLKIMKEELGKLRGDTRSIGYINEEETPSNDKTTFAKAKVTNEKPLPAKNIQNKGSPSTQPQAQGKPMKRAHTKNA